MKRTVGHVLLPALMPAVFFTIAATPVDVLGCLTRGLLALLVASVSGFAALTTAIISVNGRRRGDVRAAWWAASSGILAIPVVGLIILA